MTSPTPSIFGRLFGSRKFVLAFLVLIMFGLLHLAPGQSELIKTAYPIFGACFIATLASIAGEDGLRALAAAIQAWAESRPTSVQDALMQFLEELVKAITTPTPPTVILTNGAEAKALTPARSSGVTQATFSGSGNTNGESAEQTIASLRARLAAYENPDPVTD